MFEHTPTLYRTLQPRRRPQARPLSPHASESVARLATLQADRRGQLFIDGYRHLALTVATSCLVQPLAGDRVRFTEDGGAAVILDVLSCADTGRCLVLSSRHPAMKICAPALSVEGSHSLSLTSARLSITSRTCRWVAGHLQQYARFLRQHCVRSERQVEQEDSVLAKHIVRSATQSYRLESKLAAIHASAVLKIDGTQIHVG